MTHTYLSRYVPANERCDDPLLNTIEDPATIELLLGVMFDEPKQEEGKVGEQWICYCKENN